MSLDLSKYFDTLNHQRLLNLLRENVDDERVIQLIKRYHRIRMCIWKMWKRPRSKMKYLIKLGVPEQLAYRAANSRRKYWFVSNTVAVKMGLTKEILVRKGFYDLADAYQQMHVNY